jgi:MFS family permease
LNNRPKNPANAIRVPGTDRLFFRRRILLVLLTLLAMTLMAISSINVALPSIESSIGASNTDIQWMLSGYALSFGIVLVAAGRVGDVLGRSGAFVIGLALFTVASAACAAASDPALLNTMRIVQGVGAGIASPQVNGLILQYFEGRQRARAFAMFGLTVSVAVAIAPALTGLLIGWLGPDLGWRASFLWNVPLGLVSIILALRWLPFGTERTRRLRRKEGGYVSTRIDLDPVGMLLLALTVLCILLPFMIKQPVWFILLAVGAGLAWAWVAWERNYQEAGREPMVDLRLFRYRSFTNATVISSVQFLGGTSVFAILALYMQNGLGVAALLVGLIGLPNAIASAVASVWTGEHVLTSGRKIVLGVFGCYVVGLIICIVLAQFMGPGGAINPMWMAVPLILTGIGVGGFNSANQTLSQADIPPAIGGTAGAVKQVGERIGTAVGNAMTTAVLFALAATSWTAGFTGAYALITLIIIVAMILAFIDLRQLGSGVKAPKVPA